MKNVRISLPCGVRFGQDHCLKCHVQNKKLRSSLDGSLKKKRIFMATHNLVNTIVGQVLEKQSVINYKGQSLIIGQEITIKLAQMNNITNLCGMCCVKIQQNPMPPPKEILNLEILNHFQLSMASPLPFQVLATVLPF